MPDNPYVAVGAPNYAAPIINWFGQHPENVGQRMNSQPPAKDASAPPVPGVNQAYQNLGRWLQQRFNLDGPNSAAAPYSHGVGLPPGNATGGLY